MIITNGIIALGGQVACLALIAASPGGDVRGETLGTGVSVVVLTVLGYGWSAYRDARDRRWDLQDREAKHAQAERERADQRKQLDDLKAAAEASRLENLRLTSALAWQTEENARKLAALTAKTTETLIKRMDKQGEDIRANTDLTQLAFDCAGDRDRALGAQAAAAAAVLPAPPVVIAKIEEIKKVVEETHDAVQKLAEPTGHTLGQK